MFEQVKQFLLSGRRLTLTADYSPADEDVRLTTAVLLLRAAAIDDDIAAEEMERIAQDMRSYFSLSEEHVKLLVAAAAVFNWEEEDMDSFVEVINETFDDARRQEILALAWKVIIADKKILVVEKTFIEQLAEELKLNKHQLDQARERAVFDGN